MSEVLETVNGDCEDVATEMASQGRPFNCPACNTWQPMSHSCSIENLMAMEPKLDSFVDFQGPVVFQGYGDPGNIVLIRLNVTNNRRRRFVYKGKMVVVEVSDYEDLDSGDSPPLEEC